MKLLQFRYLILLLSLTFLIGCVTPMTKSELNYEAHSYIEDTLQLCMQQKYSHWRGRTSPFHIGCWAEDLHMSVNKGKYLPFRHPQKYGLDTKQVFTLMHEQILKKFKVDEFYNWNYKTVRAHKMKALYLLKNNFVLDMRYATTSSGNGVLKIKLLGSMKDKQPSLNELLGVPNSKYVKSNRYAETRKRHFNKRIDEGTAEVKHDIDLSISMAKMTAEYDEKESRALWGAATQGFSQGFSEGMNDWNQREQADREKRQQAQMEASAREIDAACARSSACSASSNPVGQTQSGKVRNIGASFDTSCQLEQRAYQACMEKGGRNCGDLYRAVSACADNQAKKRTNHGPGSAVQN